MVYLVDTHIILWWFADPAKLSKKEQAILSDTKNIVYVSSVSTWEIVIKKALGKLKVPDRLFDLIAEENFTPLPITIDHTRALEQLPYHHDDPFDRLLIAQSIHENLPLITHDRNMNKYDVPLLKGDN